MPPDRLRVPAHGELDVGARLVERRGANHGGAAARGEDCELRRGQKAAGAILDSEELCIGVVLCEVEVLFR